MDLVKRRKAAVVGNPISHSLSPQLHTAGWDVRDFSRIELARGEFAQFLSSWDDTWAGCAVTMPFKLEALQAADIADGLASAVGAANTIVYQPTGPNSHMSVAFNTDVAGIVNAIREITDAEMSQENGIPVHRKFFDAVILGSGATASSALAAVVQLGAANITICARRNSGPNTVFSAAHRLHIDYSYQQLAGEKCVAQIFQSELLISTLPAGIADSVADQLAILLAREARFSHSHGDAANPDLLAGKVLLDVVYDPYPSKLIQVWEQFGGTVVPGWLMLLHQAIDQARLFTGKNPDVSAMRTALQQALAARD